MLVIILTINIFFWLSLSFIARMMWSPIYSIKKVKCLNEDDDVLMLITVLEERALMWVITSAINMCLTGLHFIYDDLNDNDFGQHLVWNGNDAHKWNLWCWPFSTRNSNFKLFVNSNLFLLGCAAISTQY